MIVSGLFWGGVLALIYVHFGLQIAALAAISLSLAMAVGSAAGQVAKDAKHGR